MYQKTCRFCGLASKNNAALFVAENADLLAQAIAIYPLVIYEDDPLPNHVCRRCQTQIRTQYSNMQRAVNLNSKWVNVSRGHEDVNTYVKLLDEIEEIKSSIRKNNVLAVEGILDQCIARMLQLDKPKRRRAADEDCHYPDLLDLPQAKRSNKSVPSSRSLQSHSNNSYLSDADELPSTSTSDSLTIDPTSNENKITNLQNMLAQNGCSLITLGDLTIKKTQKHLTSDDVVISPTKSSEILSSDDDNLTLRKPSKQITCERCQLDCQSEEDLIIHNTNMHLKIRLHKIFPKRCLPKTERRGRLITIGDSRVIRCLSCFRVYESKEEILEHWNTCKCDFYCLLCTEMFPDSPKLLREHVRRAHGINHSHLRLLHENNNRKSETEIPVGGTNPPAPLTVRRTIANAKCASCCKVFQSVAARLSHMRTHDPNYIPEAKPEKLGPVEPPAKCPYCDRIFEHIRALNGHMRMHKPSSAFGNLTMSTNDPKLKDKYMEAETHSSVVVKNEPLDEATAVTAAAQLKEVNTGISPLRVTSTTSTTTMLKTPIKSHKGLIKVKAIEELLSTPAKLAMHNRTGVQKSSVFKEETPMDIVG